SRSLLLLLFFFFNAPATTQIYTLSLHDALPILDTHSGRIEYAVVAIEGGTHLQPVPWSALHVKKDEKGSLSATIDTSKYQLMPRSEEHTSELQSLTNLVCRLLLEKKKQTDTTTN